MRNARKFIKLVTVLGVSAALMATSACQSGSRSGSNNASGDVVTIKMLHTNDVTTTVLVKATADGFNASQTKYKVTLESRPGGTEGDNLVKTPLSTGEMTDLFNYHSGSLMNNLNPTKNLIPLGDQPYVSKYTDPFKVSVTSTTDNKIYGAPFGSGLKKLASGEAVHFPTLSGTIQTVVQNSPDQVKDLGFFPVPGTDANKIFMTNWVTNGIYIPTTTKGDKLEGAKAFIAWIEAADGCKAQGAVNKPNGPFGMKDCAPSGDLPQVAKDVIAYSDKNQASVALEFVAPLKGPNLESILILVGTGQKTAKEAAALYDEAVKKQAQQLNLPGW